MSILGPTVVNGILSVNGKVLVNGVALEAPDVSNLLTKTGDNTFSGNLISSARNKGVVGTYDAAKTDQIWSIGAAYTNHASGTNFGTLYGLAYKHTNNATGGTMGGGHQMVWCANGAPKCSLGEDGIWTSGRKITIAPGVGNVSMIDFANTNGANDRGWIQHFNSSTTSSMEFCVSDDPIAGDDGYVFGAVTSNGPSDVGVRVTQSWLKFDRQKLSLGGKNAFNYYDGWLRINESAGFNAGIYFGSSLVRTDGILRVGDGGAAARSVSINRGSGTSWGADKLACVDITGAPVTGSTATYMIRYRDTNSRRIFAIDVLDQSGDTHIRTGTSGDFSMTAGGDFSCNGNVTAYSDRRIKDNIKPIGRVMSKLMKAEGVYYTRTDVEDTKAKHIGVIAQDMKELFPELVTVSNNSTLGISDFHSMDYAKLSAVLLEGLKETHTALEVALKRIELLEQSN